MNFGMIVEVFNMNKKLIKSALKIIEDIEKEPLSQKQAILLTALKEIFSIQHEMNSFRTHKTIVSIMDKKAKLPIQLTKKQNEK